ncbi:MAG: hypothetical protein QG597_608, partial [Actinomycetota bacterium]|nr:hypothetical protein [Actinomycetota bacterium]
KPLLASLAREGWFTQMGEPAATKCLALLLRTEPRLQQATVSWLSSLTGVNLASVHHFEPELVQDDRARPDLVGLDSDGRPVVVVEAKFGAALTPEQLSSYLRYQQARLGDSPGALVVLVPEARLAHAQLVAHAAVEKAQWAPAGVGVTSWDAWLDTWDAEVDATASEDFLLRSDLNQLRGLIRAMDGLLGTPYAPNPEAPWRTWEADLSALVLEFTRIVNEAEGYTARDLPAQSQEPAFSPARYVLVTRRSPSDIFFRVGVSHERADQGKTPIWARLAGVHAGPIIGALHATFPHGEEDAHGQFWVPLDVPETVGSERVHFMTEQLLARMSIVRALY